MPDEKTDNRPAEKPDSRTGAKYRIIGSEESPYSVKVRSYFRYKKIPHQWLSRAEAGDLYEKHAKLPLVPLVVTPDDQALQDSTPIIETMETQHPDPSIYPTGQPSAFVSTLLEEFGDEWGNKWMFHFRWAREVDQIGCSERLARGMMPSASDAEITQAAKNVRSRMVDRVWFVGSNEITAPQIEQSFEDTIAMLNIHLDGRPYLFGARPAFADFALWGQIYNARRDHTPGTIVRAASNVDAWVDQMLDPVAAGEFEPWENLQASLMPLLTDQVASMFLPWSAANSAAINDNQEEFSVELNGRTWTQKPQKYHARSLAALRGKYAAVRDDPAVGRVVAESGADAILEN